MSVDASQSAPPALHLYPPKAQLEAASALIERAKIPHIPEVVLALRAELKSPEPDPQRAADLIVRDPAITGDLLKAVNSPAFNLRVKVNSVSQAAGLMGLQRLTQYVTAVAMNRVISGMAPRVLNLWKDIMEEVEAMVSVAEVVPGLSVEETYLFGVLHDIGALLFASRSGDYISQWVLHSGSEPSRLIAYERASMGLAHGIVGFMMAARWKLSEPLALAVCYHHAPGYLDAPDSRTNQLIAVSKAAHYLVALSQGTHALPEIEGYREDALRDLELAEHDWEDLCARAETRGWGQ